MAEQDDVCYLLNTLSEGNHDTVETRYANLDIEMVVKSENQTISADTSWGNSTPDSRNLLVRVEGDLTINAGYTLTASTRKRGMFILVKGDLNLNGYISMYARGAHATGQQVLLLDDGTEYDIPAAGADGFGQYVNGRWCSQGDCVNATKNGGAGSNGTGRQTGGGGGAGLSITNYISHWQRSGAGGNGTSYSGGVGGGGCAVSSTSGEHNAGNGPHDGGAGGNGYDNNANASGGTGNPGGGDCAYTGYSGTGGLLVIYVLGTITFGASEQLIANGRQARAGGNASGGSSGGGHISVFYETGVSGTPSFNVNGGATQTSGADGGRGGNGTYEINSSEALEVNPKNGMMLWWSLFESWKKHDKLWRNNKLILPKDLGFSY